jgi:hypothetical protein
LLVERVKFRNSIKYCLVAKISNSFSKITINVSEFNEILVRLFAIIVIFLDIYFLNSFQDIIRSFKSFYFFVDCKKS